MNRGFVYDDGGRTEAGFKGTAGDCVTRSIAIASGANYTDVYKALASGTGEQRATKGRKAKGATARSGINVKRKWFKDYMASIGATWTPTMQIGSGCKVHLCAEELPPGRLVVAVSKHYTAMIDGVIHDTFDPRRETHCSRPDDGTTKPGEWRNGDGMVHHIERRCVYGYWTMPNAA